MKHIYILGIAAYNIRKYYYAQYYLNMVANMPILTEDDALIKTNARKLVETLKKYNLVFCLIWVLSYFTIRIYFNVIYKYIYIYSYYCLL